MKQFLFWLLGWRERAASDAPDLPGSFVVDVWKLWPRADEYRVICYPNRTTNRYGLQAKTQDSYVDVLAYDDGMDDYGQLRPGRWIPLAQRCSWSERELHGLVDDILGRPEQTRVCP